MTSTERRPGGRETPPEAGGRDQARWETLEALEQATRASVELVDRLRRIEADDRVARSVPCASPYCRYKVLVTDDGATHIHYDGSTFGMGMQLAIRGHDDGVDWVPHNAEPADEHRQAERRAIIDNATACTHPHCNHPVAIVDGIAHHIDDTGTLLGPKISVPVPTPVPDTGRDDSGEGEGEQEHWTWVLHNADPAPGEALRDPRISPDPDRVEETAR